MRPWSEGGDAGVTDAGHKSLPEPAASFRNGRSWQGEPFGLGVPTVTILTQLVSPLI